MRRSEHLAQVKKLLDEIVARYHRAEFIGDDPVRCVHDFHNEEDIETAGFITAALSYGRAVSIRNSVDRVLGVLGNSPHEAVLNFDPIKDGKRLCEFAHRFTTCEDLIQFIELTSAVLRDHRRLKNVFLSLDNPEQPIREAMSALVKEFRSGTLFLRKHVEYLLPDPADGSACKRFNLYLRWMVRGNDGVDFGLWPEVKPARLVMPLDVHVGRISRKLGLLERKSDDWKAAEEITESLRAFCPEDPLRYDFAITHIGITGIWEDVIGKLSG